MFFLIAAPIVAVIAVLHVNCASSLCLLVLETIHRVLQCINANCHWSVTSAEAVVNLMWLAVVGLVWVAVIGLVCVAVVSLVRVADVGLVWVAVVGFVWVAVVGLVWVAVVGLVWVALSSALKLDHFVTQHLASLVMFSNCRKEKQSQLN